MKNCNNAINLEIKVPFYCPICNGYGGQPEAILLDGVLVATPHEPTLRCANCQQLWRINLYPVDPDFD